MKWEAAQEQQAGEESLEHVDLFVVEQMRSGKTPQEACEALCQRILILMEEQKY